MLEQYPSLEISPGPPVPFPTSDIEVNLVFDLCNMVASEMSSLKSRYFLCLSSLPYALEWDRRCK